MPAKAEVRLLRKEYDMEDEKIISLFFDRSQRALTELASKYGRLLYMIAGRILPVQEDREESVNDTYVAAWNTIPPAKPDYLKAYVCRIVKNYSLKRLRYNKAQCRSSELYNSLDELEDCLSSKSLEEEWDSRELGREINRFLEALNAEDRKLFVRRYWFSEPVKSLAASMGKTEDAISVRLFRIRKKLREDLEKNGFQT